MNGRFGGSPSRRVAAELAGVNCGVALVYALLTAVSSAALPAAAPFWPSAAVAAYAALRWGWSATPGVFAGALAAGMLACGLPPGAALVGAAGQALAPMLAAGALRRLGGSADGWWDSPRATLVFLATMGALQALLASCAIGAAAMLGGAMHRAMAPGFVGLAIGEYSAVVMLVPFVQTLRALRAAPGAQRAAARSMHAAALFVFVLVVWVLVDGGATFTSAQRTVLIDLLLFPLTWSVFMFDIRVTSALMAFTYVVFSGATLAEAHAVGNLGSAPSQVALAFFLLAAGGATLFASALQGAHRRALDRLKAKTEQLDALARDQARSFQAQKLQFQSEIVRLSDLTAVLTAVGQASADIRDDVALLQNFCDLAAHLHGVTLAWVGRPDAQGRFAVLAKAGEALHYLDALNVSIDAASPQGQGPCGKVWRQHEPIFTRDVFADPKLAPWTAQLQAYGIRAAASLPLFRGGTLWAVLNLYLSFVDGLDGMMQQVTEKIASAISLGLDRIDATRSDFEHARINDALLSNVSIGINVVRFPGNVYEHVNARLLQMVGVADIEEVKSHPPLDFYANDAEYARVGALVRSVFDTGHGVLHDVGCRRLDTGATIMMDITGVRLDLDDGAPRILWTQVDVTERYAQAQRVRHTEGVYRALAAASDSLLQSASDQDMIERLCRSLVDGTEFDSAWLVRPDEQGLFVALGTATRTSDNLRILQALRVPTDDEHFAIAKAWRSEAPTLHRADTAASAPGVDSGADAYADLLRQLHWRSLLAVPVRRGGQRWGVLLLGAGRSELFDDTTRKACEQVAALLGHGLDELDGKLALRALQSAESQRARVDVLTGLPNRLALDEYLPQALARAQRRQSLVAVGMLDLDDFKPINDNFGHAAGDALLRQFTAAIRSNLRRDDFVARLGGDELVVVFEDLDTERFMDQLRVALDRLYGAVRQPFDLGDGHSAQVAMTMGLALFPHDSREPEILLRAADAAMYANKLRKHDRAHWWRIGNVAAELAPDAREEALEPFGDEASILLGSLSDAVLDVVTSEFTSAFYGALCGSAQLAQVLGCLDADELDRLKQAQARHLRMLLKTDLRRDAMDDEGRRLGRIHALVGISAAAMEAAFGLYEDILREQLERAVVSSRYRYRVQRVISARLRLDMQAQLVEADRTTAQYFGMLEMPPPLSQRLVDVLPGVLQALSKLPGIRHVIVFRPDENGVLRDQAGAGEDFVGLSETLLAHPELYPSLNPVESTGRGPLSAGWFSRKVQVIGAYLHDPKLTRWHDLALRLGWRSAAVVPISIGDATDSALMLFGAHPHQFSSGWALSWLELLRNRLDAHFAVAARGHRPADAAHIRSFRELLYSGGLRMWVQPVVDIQTGRVVKVEALARLHAADGEIVMPGRFLPAFGEQELQVLFIQGLRQSLELLHGWRAAGFDIDIAVNLPPSTLTHPDCIGWIERALRDSGVAAEHLSLEILENGDIDPLRTDAAIHALNAQGVRLALDDLGAGYSSLTRLASLPINTVKIDQGLIQELQRDPLRTVRLLSTLLRIGSEFAARTVVEGLEDEGHVEAARWLGARLAQGYALARPMPASAFADWMRGHRPEPRGDGALRTWAGALAFHWVTTHGGAHARHAGSLEACALTRFLHAHAIDDPEVLRWHARLHRSSRAQRRDAGAAALLQWLAQRVVTNAAPAAPSAPGPQPQAESAEAAPSLQLGGR